MRRRDWMAIAGVSAAGACRAKSRSSDRTLRVLALNAWHEGTRVEGGLEKLADVILKSGADLTAIPEGKKKEGFGERFRPVLDARGGGTYWIENVSGVSIVGRLPIVEPAKSIFSGPQGLVAVGVRTRSGRVVHFVAAHLDFRYYAVNLPRGYHGGDPDWEMNDPDGDGKPDPITDPQAILEYDRRSKKDEAIAAFLAYAKPLLAKGERVILAGDFNDASHLDWTEATKDRFAHNGAVVPWPNSIALAEAGMKDSYRELHPDPVACPGITWPSEAFGKGCTSWAPESDDRERVDYVYYGGRGIRAVESYVAGSRTYWRGKEKRKMKTHDDHVLESLPWPSDHKGVLTVFDLPPGEARPVQPVVS